jgi:porin
VRPDVQYIIQPGGTGSIPDAFVLGARIGVSF